MTEYEENKRKYIKLIEDAINKAFDVSYLPIEIIQPIGSHPSSYVINVDSVFWRRISWEGMMYFQEADINYIVEDLIFAHQQGDFIKLESSERTIKLKINNYMELQYEFQPIREWAQDKGIYEKGDPLTQFAKLSEEMGELAMSLLKKNDDEFCDAIGDMVVVLTNLAKLKGYNIEDCINGSYQVIAKRKGQMINGTFVKEA